MRKIYLDGLRGWASVIVLINHVFPNFLYATAELPSVSSVITQPQLSLAFATNLALACWSILYLFISNGELAVKVFFVLSGVVLSIRFFETGDRSILSKMAVGRYARLTIPILASCILAYLLMTLGLYKNQEFGALIGNPWIGGFNAFDASLLDALRFSLYDVYIHYDITSSYNFALWTMSIELWGSFGLFVVLHFIPMLPLRIAIYAVMTIGLAILSQNLMCFALGIVVADLRSNTRFISERNLPTAVSLASCGVILFSLLVLTKIGSPASDILRAFLATAIVVNVLIDVRLQASLETKLSRTVGELSFPLYLVHPVMLCSFVSLLGMQLFQSLNDSLAAALTSAAAIIICFGAAIAFHRVEAFAIWASRLCSQLIPRGKSTRS